MKNRVTQRFVVHGRVQGVGFRAFVRNVAEAFDVYGWVRNDANGSVEILVQGTEENLRSFTEQVEIGPSSSRVDKLHVQEVEPERNYQGFTVIR